MPIFEFRCQNCSRNFELLIRSGDSANACPDCGSNDVTKKFSTFGFSAGRSAGQTRAAASTCGGCASHNCSGCHH